MNRDEGELLRELEALRRRVAELEALEAERRRVERALRTLSECDRALVHAGAEPELLQEICRVVVEIGGYQLAWVGFAERDKEKSVRPVAQAGYEAGYLETLKLSWADTELGRGPTGTAIRTGQAVICRDIPGDPRFAPWRAEATRRGYASSIALPLIVNGVPIGALNIYAAEPDAFDSREVELLTRIADDLAFGIQALRARAEHMREVTLLSRVITVAALAEDLPAVLEELCTELACFLHVPQAAFALLDPNCRAATVVAEYRGPGRPSALGITIPVADNPSMAYVLKHKAPLAVVDAQTDPQLAPVHDVMRQRGIASILLVPIIVRDEVVGTLGLDSLERREFTRDEIELVERVAIQAGQVLERLQLFQETRARAELMSRLAALSDGLNRRLSVDDVVAAIGEGALTLSGTDRVAVYLRDPEDRAFCVWSRGLSARYTAQVATHVERVPGRQLWTDPHPILISDTDELPYPRYRWLRNLAKTEEIRAIALWPMVYEGRMIATLGCYYEAPHTWPQSEREVMETFARQAAVALQNARLYDEMRRMNEDLRKAVKLRDEMIQNVSHELRTPLTLIMGYVQLLQEGQLGPIPETQKDAVDTIDRQSQKLHYMVERLLMLQTLNKESLNLIPLTIEPFLRRVIRAWEEKAARAGIRLRLDIAGELPPVLADSDLLGELIYNLLDNAIKFSPHGGTVEVRARRSEREIVIAVSDQGVGIPPDELESVFKRFYQVDGSSTRSFGGMGIGLSLCRKIAEAHGGRIWAESAGEGQGSTFYVSLPIIEV